MELRGRGPPGDPRLAGSDAAARPRQALRRARALGAADVLPVPEHDARAGGEPCEGGPDAPAGAHASHAPGPRGGRAVVRRGGAPSEGGRVDRGAGPGHGRAVLLHGNPSRRAGGAERAGRGPRVGPGEGARQGQKGAARAAREPCGTRAAPLLPPARRAGAYGNARRPGGVRGPARAAAVGAGRAARDQATAGHADTWPRPARALAAPLVRHAPARRRRRPAGRAGAAGPRVALDHASVYSYIRGTTQEGVSPGTSPRMRDMQQIHSTTILCVRRDGHVALGGDGQVTIGDTVMKANANKVRALKGGKIRAGIAGAAADRVTLFEKFDEKLDSH